MKKKLFSLYLLLDIALRIVAQEGISINNQLYYPDTLDYRQVGPGIVYTKFAISDLSFTAYVMSIDLSNPYNEIETFQANDLVGKTEAMTEVYKRLSYEGHKSLGSTNGSFWIVTGQGEPTELLGTPRGGSVRLGEMITNPDLWNRRGQTEEEKLEDIGYAIIDENNKICVDDMGFDGVVSIEEVGNYPIYHINRLRSTNELVFYNSYIGTTKTNDDGTEVFLEPIEGQNWQVNRDITCRVTRVVKNKGRNLIKEGESVLSGNGKAQEFLDNLEEGDLLNINMGVYTRRDGLKPLVKEMISGNALIMKNGILTYRNYNEDYNQTLYARTGVGASEDGNTAYLIVIDNRGASKGATTATMAEILKASGAVSAASLDGGGSAQLMLAGEIVNTPGDGRERSVANGWMFFSTAPESEILSKIEFSDYKVTLPVHSSYSPNILLYNDYGELIQENLEGYTLSCSSELGTVRNGSIFIASATPTEGILTATYQELSVSKKVVIESADIEFVLDSVILDLQREYQVEVKATSQNGTFEIAPSNLVWENSNPEICEVKEGVITALANGEAMVKGSIGDKACELLVKVQIPEVSGVSVLNFMDETTWKLTGTKTLEDITLIPFSETSAEIKYTYQKAASPDIRISSPKPVNLYGIPDFIKVVFNPGEIGLSKVILGLRSAPSFGLSLAEYTTIEIGADNVFLIHLNEVLGEEFSHNNYPLKFDYITFFLRSSENVAGKDYTLLIKEISLGYDGYPPVAISSLSSEETFIYENPVVGKELRLFLSEPSVENLKAEIFSLSGQCIYIKTLSSTIGQEIVIPLENVETGIYILRLYMGKEVKTLKLHIL